MKYIKLLVIVVALSMLLLGCSDDDVATGEGNAVVSFEQSTIDVVILNDQGVNIAMPVILQEGTTPAKYPIKVEYEAVGLNGINADDYILFSAQDKVLFINEFDEVVSNTPFLDFFVVEGPELAIKPEQQVIIRMVAVQGATMGEISSVTINITK